MERLMNLLASKKDALLDKESSTWFNGHGYFPLHIYKLEYEFEQWSIEVLSEWRVSESVRTNQNSQDPFSSKYLLTINALTDRLSGEYEFTTSVSHSILRFFKREVSITTKSSELLKKLSELTSLKSWYLNSEFPLSNEFRCDSNNGATKVSTFFNTDYNPEEKIIKAIKLIELFCSTINSIEQDKNR